MVAGVLSSTLINVRRARFAIKNDRSYTLKFRIKTSSARMSAPVVYAMATTAGPDPVPHIYDTYNYFGVIDNGVYCVSTELEEQESDSHTTWILTAEFGQLPPGETPITGQVASPLDRPISYRLEHLEETIPVGEYYDAENVGGALTEVRKVLRNSAGEQFADPITQEEYSDVLVADKNVANLQTIIDLNQTYRNRLNSDTFYGAPPYHAKCLPIVGSELQFENGIAFYTATFRVAFREQGFVRQIVDQGYNYKDNNGDLKLAVDKDGTPKPLESLLDGNGKLLPDGDEGITLSRRTHPSVSFAGMGI